MLGFWIFIVLLIALLLATPWWPYSRGWGYWPGGALLTVLLVWMILIWLGWVVFTWPWVAPPPV